MLLYANDLSLYQSGCSPPDTKLLRQSVITQEDSELCKPADKTQPLLRVFGQPKRKRLAATESDRPALRGEKKVSGMVQRGEKVLGKEGTVQEYKICSSV
jgi:hypothetical protein